jgi:hypothetical protein
MSQRFYETLIASGIPAAYTIGSTKADIAIVYQRDATTNEKQAVQQIINGFDWSIAAEQAWTLNKNKDDAINSLDTNLSISLIERNAFHIIYNQISGLTVALNRLTDAHNLKTVDTVPKLNTPGTWQQAVQVLKNQIQSE